MHKCELFLLVYCKYSDIPCTNSLRGFTPAFEWSVSVSETQHMFVINSFAEGNYEYLFSFIHVCIRGTAHRR